MSKAIIDPSSPVWRESLVICPYWRKYKTMLDQEDYLEGIGSGLRSRR